MAYFLWQKLLSLLLTLLAAAALIFAVLHLLPGNAAQVLLGPDADPQAVAALATQLGLDTPAWPRFTGWLRGLLHGDLGHSYAYGEPVADLLLQRLQLTVPLALLALGVERQRIVWDYGIGFGKTVAQNFSLLAHQAALTRQGFALLAGWSRKSSLGQVTNRPVEERMVPSVAAAVLAVERGARIVRVHDVAETVSALAVWQAMHDNE